SGPVPVLCPGAASPNSEAQSESGLAAPVSGFSPTVSEPCARVCQPIDPSVAATHVVPYPPPCLILFLFLFLFLSVPLSLHTIPGDESKLSFESSPFFANVPFKCR